MDMSEEQVATLNLKERSPVMPNEKNLEGSLDSDNENITKMDKEGIAEIDSKIIIIAPCSKSPKRIGPIVPPKPYKKKPDSPEVPQSYIVKQVCEPHYSKRLQSLTVDSPINQNISSMVSIFQGKHPVNTLHKDSPNKVTLDNPVLLEQQLEALAHHKRQLEKRGLFSQQQSHNEKSSSDISDFPNLMSQSQAMDGCKSGVIYSNVRPTPSILNSPVFSLNVNPINADTKHSGEWNTERNITQNLKDLKANRYTVENGRNFITNRSCGNTVRSQNEIYSNLTFEDNSQDETQPPSSELSFNAIEGTSENSGHNKDVETPPPPSPVSSSYSELRRATDVFKKPYISCYMKSHEANISCNDNGSNNKGLSGSQPQTYLNVSCNNEFKIYCATLQTVSQDTMDFYSNGSSSQGSTTYESIYEPIIPRPASQLSSHANYLNYVSYVNGPQLDTSESGGNVSTIGSISTSGCNTPSYPSVDAVAANANSKSSCQQKEIEVEALTDFLVHSLDTGSGVENYGTCFKCNERVVGENSGCTAMEQIYHIACFTCTECKINLQGKPFYALDGKPLCEYDYLQTLEKCSVCMKPILERILRATGKPYHPQCFTCIICGHSLDGIPFTVDATNQNYCISDFHKKFAPRCCVCLEPIMPEPGEEETVRVVALDRSFHFECYKCEDCGLLLSSEAEGRGCYPLDGHVLCKSCNAKRVQMLTSRMTTEL